MDVSDLAIRIIFLLLPGALAASIYWKVKGRATRKDWEDFLEVIIFSLFSYILYAILTYVLSFFDSFWKAFGLQAKTFSLFQAFFDEKAKLDLGEIFYVSLLSVPIAVSASYAYRYRSLNRIGRKIGATTRFGDEDVWDFFHRSHAIRSNWTTIRDHKLNLYYWCWIEMFSDSGKERELLLRKVEVHDDSGERLYETDVMYVSRKHDELTIEVLFEVAESERIQLEDSQ